MSNLAGVYVKRNEYAHAEELYKEAIQIFVDTLPAGHLNVGIAEIKLGHALLMEHRYRDAEAHSLLRLRNRHPPDQSLGELSRDCAPSNLAGLYDALNEPQKARKYRAAVASR